MSGRLLSLKLETFARYRMPEQCVAVAYLEFKLFLLVRRYFEVVFELSQPVLDFLQLSPFCVEDRHGRRQRLLCLSELDFFRRDNL